MARNWKGTGRKTRDETEQQRIARITLRIKQMQRITEIKEHAVDLPGRIGFFGLACFKIAAEPRPQSNTLKEGIEVGAKLLEETTKCLDELRTFKSTGPETLKVISYLKKSRKLLQRMLRRINALAKKSGQKK